MIRTHILFMFVLVLSLSGCAHTDVDVYNLNERELINKIVELPLWNFDFDLTSEYIELAFKNSNIKKIDFFEEDRLIFTFINQKFQIQKDTTDHMKIVSDKIYYDDNLIGEVKYYY